MSEKRQSSSVSYGESCGQTWAMRGSRKCESRSAAIATAAGLVATVWHGDSIPPGEGGSATVDPAVPLQAEINLAALCIRLSYFEVVDVLEDCFGYNTVGSQGWVDRIQARSLTSSSSIPPPQTDS